MGIVDEALGTTESRGGSIVDEALSTRAGRTTPRKELEGEIGKMSGTQKSLVALGSGLWRAGKGVQQAFYDVTGQKDKSKAVAQDVAEAEQQMNVLKGTAGAKGLANPYSRMEAYGEILPVLPIRGGIGGSIGRNMLTGAGAGAVVGGTQVVPEGESRARNMLTGAAVGAALPAVAPLIKKGAEYVAKPMLGKLTGAGSGSIDEAFQAGGRVSSPIKSETEFAKGMRGKTGGDDVVTMAHDALRTIKDKRAAAYQEKLKKITELSKDEVPNAPGSQMRTPPASNIDITPITKKATELAERYGIRITDDGKLDFSRIAMGRAGRRDVAEVVKKLMSWGNQPGDRTAIGLDTLKRQLDDFYSDSSQARQFVASLRDTVRKTISDVVPEYAEMTKGYADATKLIKDIESGLMMRKTGISGRITHDQTLRRLTSAMRDNFELRKDLVEALGAEGAKDIKGAIAGYTMSTAIPRQLGSTGALVVSEIALAKLLNPKIWPLIAASSPRVVGEFVHTLGYSNKVANQIAQAIPKAVRSAGKQGVQRIIAKYATRPKPAEPPEQPQQWQEIGTEE